MTIELPDETAAALNAKAEAAGLTVQEWLKRVADAQEWEPLPGRHIAEIILERMKDVPPEDMAAMPRDGASEHDHYIYGWPKRNV
jgi:hypothetical protein